MNAAPLFATSVNLTPDSSGLPGTSSALSLLGGLWFYGLLFAIAAVILSGIWWAASAHSNNYQGAAHGRSGVVVSILAALVIGFGPSLVQWFFNFGQSAH